MIYSTLTNEQLIREVTLNGDYSIPMIIELTERFEEFVKDNDKLYEKLAEAQAELLEIIDSLNATIEAQRETLADFGMV